MADNNITQIGWLGLTQYLDGLSWREETWKQLEKDVRLSGSAIPLPAVPENLEKMSAEVSRFLGKLKTRRSEWDSFLYRVDLPGTFDVQAMETSETARLIIMRCFQKAWLRKHYSEAGRSKGDERP